MSGSPLSAERGRIALAALRPKVSSRLDLLRAKGKLNPNGSKVDEPSRFPCESGAIFVGRGGHALDLGLLRRLCIGAVLNCAPNVCTDPESKYEKVMHYRWNILTICDASIRLESRTCQLMLGTMPPFVFWTVAWRHPLSSLRPRTHVVLECWFIVWQG
jgi:hypothetical protein